MISLFSIYDCVVGEYGSPFIARNTGEAVRTFNSVMERNPHIAKDCKLYAVGSFDPETGRLGSTGNPEFVCNYEGNENGG